MRLVNLWTHDVHSAPPAQKGDVQIFLVRKTVMIFVILKMNERADGNQKEKGFPREMFDFLLPSTHGRRHICAGRRSNKYDTIDYSWAGKLRCYVLCLSYEQGKRETLRTNQHKQTRGSAVHALRSFRYHTSRKGFGFPTHQNRRACQREPNKLDALISTFAQVVTTCGSSN